MSDARPITMLCLASYEKGQEFMRECKRQNCRVLLLTSESIAHADWPRESIDEIFLIPDEGKKQWKLGDVIKGVSYMARTERIDRIVPLDDFDLETAAALREHLRVPGMGETTTRYFRDKLAMRVRATEAGIAVPEFIHVLNHERLRDFMKRVPAPWLIKPRFEASATGIKKLSSPDEFWAAVERLGDRQSYYLLERYVPGDIYHVDSIVSEKEVIFAAAHKYGSPPLDVAHEGGVFTTATVERGSEDERALLEMNDRVLGAKNLMRGVSHTEFIKGREDGQFYFLETSARVGGANIVELVEAATGMNLWAEWAKIEIARGAREYELPPLGQDYAGLLVSLARQQHPDTSAYNDQEVAWRMNKPYHAGLIVRSPDPARVAQLLDEYTRRFYTDFFARQPPTDRPVN
ncbi:MAG TPA: ATP-grasp domain-containing protein [Pyrinomonadaceae bacterium]|nr:ATP-grasp domain-containing protein [Pyrinomonadaceae bacterium]